MADFLSDLASKAGIANDQAQQSVGAMLALLKSKLSPESFAHIKNAIPSSDDMVASVQDKIKSGGAGLVEGVKNLASKVLGGGQDATAAMESHFANLGVSTDQLKNFLPHLHEMLANKLPANVMSQIEQHVPGFSPAETEHVSSDA
jgi:hypothetical protein